MQQALVLAAKATMATSPNPRVGCLLVKDGEVVGQGYTQPVGQAHAEVMALRDAASRGKDARGATAYVTLEPCSHFGRTPPCANALIEVGVARVVAALEDANPQVAGRGFALLRDAGIVVEHGLMAHEAREMNLGFFKRMETGRPWLHLKMAASLDGFTALPNGQSQWITDAQAREDGHRWRARADAIITGIGTVLADDPQMNIRLPEGSLYQPRKFVLDSHLRTPANAKILSGAPTTIVHSLRNAQLEDALQQAGASLMHLPSDHGHIDLPALMLALGALHINEVHLEAGATLSGAFIAAHCVDELVMYLAPKLLGSGMSMFALPVLQTVAQAGQLDVIDVRQVGEAIRIVSRPK